MTFSSPGVNRGMVVPPGNVYVQSVLHVMARCQARRAESCAHSSLDAFAARFRLDDGLHDVHYGDEVLDAHVPSSWGVIPCG